MVLQVVGSVAWVGLGLGLGMGGLFDLGRVDLGLVDLGSLLRVVLV